jgi:hypothetical protein
VKVGLTRNGEGVDGRSIPGGGEAEISPEMGTVRLAVKSPMEVMSKNLG